MKRTHWTKKKAIEALVAFYRINKRFPFVKENGQGGLYYACRSYIGSRNSAIELAKHEMKKQNGESPFRLPCGELDSFFTRCYHKRSCANGHRCPIAVNGSGHPQAAMNINKTEFI